MEELNRKEKQSNNNLFSFQDKPMFILLRNSAYMQHVWQREVIKVQYTLRKYGRTTPIVYNPVPPPPLNRHQQVVGTCDVSGGKGRATTWAASMFDVVT